MPADCWGPEAEAFLTSQVAGKLVTLEYDSTRCRPGTLDRCRGDFGRLLAYDGLEARFRELKLRRDPGCSYCAEGKEFPGYTDYAFFCGI